MPDTRETFFLPAARLSQDKILDLAREIAASPTALSMGLVPLAVIIVNETRQIVYANERFTGLIGASSFDEVAGKRPGEALGCSHAWETQGGCGTSQSCRYCGAAKAIVRGLEGHEATQECSIIRQSADSLNALNLQVWTSPFSVGKDSLVLSSILDIAHEKSLRSFERIFFHDIMNAVTGIKGLHDLIALELGTRYGSELELLQGAVENIRDIIESHKDFLAVETQEYIREDSSFETLPLLTLLESFCQAFNAGGRKQLVLDSASPNISVCSDVRLVQRILVNMIKNALEASRAGDVVRLGCLAAPDGGVTFWVQNPGVMPKETRLRVFEKGFSTKGRGRGFGTYGMRLFAKPAWAAISASPRNPAREPCSLWICPPDRGRAARPQPQGQAPAPPTASSGMACQRL